MNKKDNYLSKSKYCEGIRCPKILWLNKNKPNEKEDVLNKTVIENGYKVGELARSYFGDYDLVEFSFDSESMAQQTKSFIENGADTIAEASFFTDELFCAVDILRKNGNGWDIYEVKSSTEVKDIYIDDMAFQYYVLSKSGIKVNHVFNMIVNNEYVFHEKLDLKKYFKIIDFTDICIEKFNEVEKNVISFREYTKLEEEPCREIDKCCNKPYECGFKNYCWKHIPVQSIFSVSDMRLDKKFSLYQQGIVTYEDIIKNNVSLNKKYMQQVESSYYHKKDEVDISGIKKFLDTISYPIYHFDFETFQQAIPSFENLRPYQNIPFQYSLHIEYEDGRLEHREYLAEAGIDPRREIAEKLCEDIPRNACLLAYNMRFEKRIIHELAIIFPDLSQHLFDIEYNFHDLMDPFNNRLYYSNAMNGGYSIKNVLPALFPDDPELNYHNLEQIHKGDEASNSYANMSNLSEEEAAILRKNLLKYCELDTYAMVKILGKLKGINKGD